MQYTLIANWKCHKSSSQGRQWFDEFARHYRPHQNLKVVVAPSLLSLETLSDHLRGLDLKNVSLGGQDVSPFPRGGYTGAVSADMLKPLVDTVIVGHSERRRYFHESDNDVVNKVSELAECGLTPLVCVDGENPLSQLGPLFDIESEKMIVGYCPVDALNFRIAESAQRVAEQVDHLKNMFPRWPVVYGGALQVKNVAEYLALSNLDGLFIGSASLEARKFADICSQAADRLG